MTETTYENLTRRVDRISAEMREIGEKNGLSRLSLLANQTKTIKEDLSRLLWIELPELNDSHKIEAVSKSTTGIFFALVILKWMLCEKHSLNAKQSTFLITKQSNRRI